MAIADWHLADNGQVHAPASRGIGIDSLVAITFDAAHQAGAKGVADAPRDRDMKVRMHDITVLGGRRSWTPRNWTRRGGGVRGPAHSLARTTLADLGPVLSEPRADLMTHLTAVWQSRYAR